MVRTCAWQCDFESGSRRAGPAGSAQHSAPGARARYRSWRCSSSPTDDARPAWMRASARLECHAAGFECGMSWASAASPRGPGPRGPAWVESDSRPFPLVASLVSQTSGRAACRATAAAARLCLCAAAAAGLTAKHRCGAWQFPAQAPKAPGMVSSPGASIPRRPEQHRFRMQASESAA